MSDDSDGWATILDKYLMGSCNSDKPEICCHGVLLKDKCDSCLRQIGDFYG
jgi:hypothetical protein